MAKRSKADVKHAIDLLWSHQIRRENAALHKEVKRLQQQVESQIDEARELRTVSEKGTAAAETAITCVEKALADQTTLQGAVNDAHRQAQDAIDKVANLENSLQDARANQTETITHFNQDIEKLQADLARFEDQYKLNLSQTGTTIQHVSTELNDKCDKSELADLQHRINHIEDFLQQGQTLHSVSRIEDSVGEQPCGGYTKETNPLVTFEKSLRTSGQSLLQNGNGDAELMLTLRDANDRDESTEVEDIDLDENVTTMSYANNLRRDMPMPDSLVMLPQHDSHLTQAIAVQPLKQGRFHSWDRYFAEGQALVKKHPRKLECDIVKSFVDGLYATKQREQCEQWLDVNGWTWDSVGDFGLSSTPSVPVHLDSIGPRALKAADISAEKQIKSILTRSSVSAITRRSKDRANGDLKGKSNLKTRNSQRLRHQSQVATSAQHPQGINKTKKPPSTGRRSQATPTKVVTPRRNAQGRFRRQRSSSPIIAASALQAGVHESIAERRKTASKRRAKPDVHAPSTTQTNARPPKQQDRAVPSVPKASNRLETIQEVPERLNTPPIQQTPSQGPEQTIPRLVRRRKSVDRISEEQSKKRRRLMDEEGLPPLPPQPIQQVEKGEGRRRKRRRLPLPPPPEIPIMPTSDE